MAELKGDYRKFMDKSYLGAWDVPDDGDLIVRRHNRRAPHQELPAERDESVLRELRLRDRGPRLVLGQQDRYDVQSEIRRGTLLGGVPR